MILGGAPEDLHIRCPSGPADQFPNRSRFRRDEGNPRLMKLLSAVEGEIVPRLLLSSGQGTIPAPVPANAGPLDTGDAVELARLLLAHEVDVPFAYVEAIRQRGVPVPHLYLQLLAPAARRLGELWERDECDFLQVTLGLGRLHQLLQRLSVSFAGNGRADSRGHGRRALLVTAPGEHHAFGVMMVSQFFRQNGWDVWNELPESLDELSSLVKQRPFAVVGISAGSESLLESVMAAVRTVRRTSMNRNVAVMVGGSVFASHPDLVSRVGADATAIDGPAAALRAESVSALLAGER